jgi:hypothetical protein
MRFTSIARTLNVEKVRLASDLVRRPSSAMARHRIVDQQHHHRTNDCNDHAVNVQTSHAAGTKQTEQKATDERADDAQGDVEPETLAVFVDDLAPDETGNQAKYDPANDTHFAFLLFHNNRRIVVLLLAMTRLVRHCERSEAIQREPRWTQSNWRRRAGLLRRFAPRNDESPNHPHPLAKNALATLSYNDQLNHKANPPLGSAPIPGCHPALSTIGPVATTLTRAS